MKKLSDCFTMNSGLSIPCIGFGTWQAPEGQGAIDAVKFAIESGYRHIDGAACYENEKSVGLGIKQSGIKREEIFVTSKLWNSERGYDSTLRAFDRTLSDLGLEYLDLYLIHWPAAPKMDADWQNSNAQTWRAFEKLHADGKIKTLGLSNFLPHHIQPLLETAKIIPAVNQLELHIGYVQSEAVEFCKKHNILIQAWSPLGRGQVLNNPNLVNMANRYGKTTAQLCIRWCLQNEFLPLPKSVTPSRIIENTQVFDFEISAADMEYLNKMPQMGYSGLHPDEITF